MATATIEAGAAEAIAPEEASLEFEHGPLEEKLRGAAEVAMLFDLGRPVRRMLEPDIAFVSHEKWRKGRKVPSGYAFRVVPELVVEVVSPSNSAIEVEEKIVEYRDAGVRLIWIVFPTTERIDVHDGSNPVQVVAKGAELDGGEIFPEFRLPLATLFEVGLA